MFEHKETLDKITRAFTTLGLSEIGDLRMVKDDLQRRAMSLSDNADPIEVRNVSSALTIASILCSCLDRMEGK